ncbi:hypothetical protein [Anaerosolibacter sp.]|uniref:hypothetical protein n=1 Tax=Anaerosolibacter sp. TaxID=1872527 RepID=UPI0039F0D37F
MKKENFDEKRAIELYGKYGSLNRAALSAGCSPAYLKKILIKHGIEIKTPPPFRMDINSRLKPSNEISST